MTDLPPESDTPSNISDLIDDGKYIQLRELEIKQRELGIKEAEAKWSWIVNPLTSILIGLLVAWGGSFILTKEASEKFRQSNREFCYKVLTDFMSRHPEQGQKASEAELYAITSAIAAQASCDEIVREYMNKRDKFAAVSPMAPTVACTDVKNLRELGWRSGHKTKFCQAKGYSGVFNPFGDYSLGGFCFTGDSAACQSKIEAQVH